eukprot:TRINITY_DN62964_c0_g2_i1.p1 TRINITY_DN62964_c0_g2~~TRINITY_DN62964_c0_g2_i1.p1  ORF type:complete len:590 (-),score=221.53 TRINITY_DN62964_c0_g2_i1:70-1839(-)
MSRIASYERPLSLALTYSVSALHLCCSLYFGRLLWRRREIMPIRGRLVRVVLLTSVLTNLWSWTFSLLVQLEEDMSCETLFVTFFSYTVMIGALYMVRCLVIVFKYQLTEQRMQSFGEQLLEQEQEEQQRQQQQQQSRTLHRPTKQQQSSAFITRLTGRLARNKDADDSKQNTSESASIAPLALNNTSTGVAMRTVPNSGITDTMVAVICEDSSSAHDNRRVSASRDRRLSESTRRLPLVSSDEGSASSAVLHRRQRRAIQSIAESDSWFVRHQWLIRDRTLCVLFAGWCIVWFAVMVLFLLFVPAPRVDQQPNARELCRWEAATRLVLVVMAVLLCAMFVFGMRLRAVVEGFHIKSELKMTALTYLLSMTLWRLFLDRHDRVPTSVLSSQVGMFIGMMISIGYPLYWSYVTESSVSELRPSGGSHQRLTTLQQVLEDDDAKELFRQWLFREFADENLMFLDTVNAWLDDGHQSRHAHEPQVLLDEASAVVEKFFVPSAEFEVCMPARISHAVRRFNPKARHAEDAQRRLKYIIERLQEARDTTMDLLRRDTFLRFKAMCEPLDALRRRRLDAAKRAARLDAFVSISTQ